jgi:hypothetical protein
MWKHYLKKNRLCNPLVGKPEVKRPFGRPRRRREDGIRMEWEIGWEEVE